MNTRMMKLLTDAIIVALAEHRGIAHAAAVLGVSARRLRIVMAERGITE